MFVRLFAILAAVAIAGCGHPSSSLPPEATRSSPVTPQLLHVVPIIQFQGGSFGSQPSPGGAAAAQLASRRIRGQSTGGCISLQGSIPGGLGGLIGDPRKALFGAFSCGGVNECGVVYELTPTGGASTYKETVLHTFAGNPDGCSPSSAVVMDHFGAIYGTTADGGNGSGTVFKLTPSLSGYNYAVIYRFLGGSDGSKPLAPVLVFPNGDLYGTTSQGGGTNNDCFSLLISCGTVFELVRELGRFSNSYGERVVYRFQGRDDGGGPEAGLVRDSAGNLYGTTQLGGIGGFAGTAFKLTRAGDGYVQSVIQSFGETGSLPMGLTLVGNDLYGVLACCSGEVFKLTPSTPAYTMSIVHRFQLQTIGDGIQPDAPLTFRNGVLYGTTLQGGVFQPIGDGQFISNGTVFSVEPSGANFEVLYRFPTNGALGVLPSGGQLLNVDGVLYGTTIAGGGPASDGAAYELSP